MHIHPLLRRALSLVLLASLLVFVLASVAAADTGGTTTIPDLFNTAQLIALIGGVVIPFVVQLLTKYAASPWVMSVVAVLSAGLLALGTYLTDTAGAHTWKGGVSVFVIALVSAAASRVTVTGGFDTKLGLKTENFGLGRTHAKAA